MKLKRVKLLLFYCLCFYEHYSQSNQYVFSHINYSNGLSNDHITCCFKDSKGFMWIGTQAGLNRYDGNKIKQFKHDPNDSTTLVDNYIYKIFEGPDNNLWVETVEGKFNIYNASTEKFDSRYTDRLKKWQLPERRVTSIVKGKDSFWFLYADLGLFRYITATKKVIPFKNTAGDNTSISPGRIIDIKEDMQGNAWIIHQDGLIEKIDGLTDKVVFKSTVLQKRMGNNPVDYFMYIDGQNDLWIYSAGIFKGIYFYQPTTNLLKHLVQAPGNEGLNSNYIYNIIQDAKGLIWLATDHGGINVVNKNDFSIKKIMHSDEVSKSLPENTITFIYKDNLNIVWAGTNKSGISYSHEKIIKFPQYKHQPANPSSLSYDDINSFVEDKEGNLWIGANGGGLIYFNRKKNSFQQYLHQANNPGSLSNNIIVSLLVDKTNKLWVGTYFGGLDCFDGKTFRHYRHNDSLQHSLADDRVMSLYEDADNNLWVGTLGRGIDKFDKEKEIFIHHTSEQSNSVVNNFVSCIAEDGNKNLWVGTAFGIDVLERNTGKFVHYSMENSKLSNNNVICLYKDYANRMWVGTREGLNVFNAFTKTFQSFTVQHGLTNNIIRSITEDDKHDIWIGTSNGISNIHLLTNNEPGVQITSKNYDEHDGLQGREFNEKAGLKMKSGELVFGGLNGFNLFKPDNIVRDTSTPLIVFTDLQVFNESIAVGAKTGNHVILDKSISETKEITLKYNENVFSIEFSALNYINTGKYKYAYMLEGFNKTWLTCDGSTRKAIYTNLDPGEYMLKVKAANENGIWKEKEISLKITILPPFWRTPLAYILYVIAIIAILYFARQQVIKKERLRFDLENERQETNRIHALDMVKIRFFTNMSHELRTPLSLILAPIEKLLDTTTNTILQKQYTLINRNAKRLLNMVNQLLDFRKMEVNELKLHPEQGDILNFIRETTFSFTDLADKKNISFFYESDRESFYTHFDHDKIERILFNLLSNAFKFTPENGTVSVQVKTIAKEANAIFLELKVQDSGIGIAQEKHEKIFERFFQNEVPGTILNQGSGIGLAITREFVKMHGGTITVRSEINKGTCFTLALPFEAIKQQIPEINEMIPNEATNKIAVSENLADNEEKTGLPRPEQKGIKKQTVLIIEDNEDFRFYLKDNIGVHYNILEAVNGKEGWQKALAAHPDMIVSDISMPEMDGITLCRKIKGDERTRQIPVVLLTALSGEGMELSGLETGASDYLTKPFNFEILLSKIKNLLAYKDVIKKTYQKQVQVNQPAMEIESADGKFIQAVLQLLEKNMDNPDFSVEELSRELHYSRATLYKKLLTLTGKSPLDFIRHVRLKRAAMLLEKSQLTVAEIAYNVGFNNPKYFTQYFKAEFKLVPSVYRSESLKKNSETE